MNQANTRKRRAGRPRFANVHEMGIAPAARAISERIYDKNGTCKVWILKDGDIAVRQATDAAYAEPDDAELVGVYTRLHSTWQLMEDITAHVRSLAA